MKGFLPSSADIRPLHTFSKISLATDSRLISWIRLARRGRGIVACDMICPNAVLEVAPAIPIELVACDESLRQYIFITNREGDASLKAISAHALVFGLMSLCNHAIHPNARVRFQVDNDGALEACLIASQRIAKGDEVSIFYPDLAWYQNGGFL